MKIDKNQHITKDGVVKKNPRKKLTEKTKLLAALKRMKYLDTLETGSVYIYINDSAFYKYKYLDIKQKILNELQLYIEKLELDQHSEEEYRDTYSPLQYNFYYDKKNTERIKQLFEKYSKNNGGLITKYNL